MKRVPRRLILAFFCLTFTAGLYAQERLAGPNDPNAIARPGQAEIIINAENADRDIAVWINGVTVAHVRPKTREKIIVHNGQNVVEAADTTAKGSSWNIGSKKKITVDSNSNSVTIGLTTRYGALLNLSIQNTTALGGGGVAAPPPAAQSAPQPARSAPAASPLPSGGGTQASLDNAIYRAAEMLMESIPSSSVLAVLSMATNNPRQANDVIEELTYVLVQSRKYKVVDRSSLDKVREESNFQVSGDVDDNSAVSIGKLLGANIIITGSVGDGRLRAKALNVQTAEIVAMASERY